MKPNSIPSAGTKAEQRTDVENNNVSPFFAKPNVVCQGGKIKRLFLETDVLQADELRSAQRQVSNYLEDKGIAFSKDVFDEVKDFAWHKGEDAWEAVKRCDEIYSDSALVPLCGYGSYTGSVVVMDVMMQKAITENIKGKSLYFLRSFDDIKWDGIDYKLFKKCFKKGVNDLYAREYDKEYNTRFELVDVSKIKRW